MKRRTFLRSSAVAASAAWSCLAAPTRAEPQALVGQRGAFAVDTNHVRFFTPAVSQPVRVLVVADTHLFRDDERGDAYRQYSRRMAGAYNQTIHFLSGEVTNPEESFVRILEHAGQRDVALVALVGDIFSFPSEAAIEWVGEKLHDAGLPYLYVAGNHDWHYEGMPGSLDELRAEWTERRLMPLYQGHDPLMACYQVGGIRFLAIDDSHYQILPEQLDFLRSHVASGEPIVLALHIPLFAPSRSVGFGCGHPDWGAETDRGYELERRPRWPAAGHSQVTFDFHREVFSAPNLLGVFAGHIHQPSLDVVAGVPQFVVDDNASGAFLEVEFLPAV